LAGDGARRRTGGRRPHLGRGGAQWHPPGGGARAHLPGPRPSGSDGALVSTGLVERAAGLLARRLDRRSFVSRAAMVGSAAVVAPATFALTPTSAYAAVCNCSGSRCVCGSLCCDGYTEFCCTLNG